VRWIPDEPYNDLPRVPPRVALETPTILKAVIEARTVLAALDQAASRMTNPGVLINTIPLLEAQASSEIENIVTTTDELFRYAADEAASASAETKETLRYRTALIAGIQSIRQRPLSVTTAVEICSQIHRREMRIRDLPGTIIANPVTRRAIYTPPEGETVLRDLLSNWAEFVHNSQSLDPLVRMAVAHYQFEAIHPFADGNGRTGRILNILMLVDSKLLREPILYLSRGIIERKDEYYRLLLDVTRNAAWEAWLIFMLEVIRDTAAATLAKIDAVDALQSRARDVARTTSAGADSDLLDVLFEQPYCRISDVVDRCGVTRQTAAKWLGELAERGVVRALKVGRERLFINDEFLQVLTRDENPRTDDVTLF
jgi:Fic family protein